VAVRVSSHPLVQALLAVFARPLISTSANSPGSLPARTATQALAAGLALGMGDDLWLLDGGPLEPSDPSTIVDCTRPEPMVVRPGAIPLEWLRSVVPEIGESTEAPEAHMRLLFVCSGNTCRSPLAEALARRAARRLGLGELEVRSAGVGTLPGQPASEGARKAARSHGLDLGGHLSVPLDRELVRWADLILTMDSTHLRRVLELGGEGKSALLGAYAGGRSGPGASDPSLEVPDPFGRDDGAYERTLRLLERYVDSVMGLLAKEAKE
jgi:protein-tyrosine phosphatase